MKKYKFLSVIAMILFFNNAFAEDVKPSSDTIFTSIDYPELQVVPRASERLVSEAQNEKNSSFLNWWPFLTSGLTTTVAGVYQYGRYKDSNTYDRDKKSADQTALLAEAVGVSTLATVMYLRSLEFYNRDLAEVTRNRGTGKKVELAKERYAEEALEKPAYIIRRLTWISVFSNVLVNAALISNSTDDSRSFNIVALASSFLPLIYANHYTEVYNLQEDYKKKIYSPLVGMSVYKSQKDQQWKPDLVLSWNF